MNVNARKEKIFTVESQLLESFGRKPSAEIALPATPSSWRMCWKSENYRGHRLFQGRFCCKLDHLPQLIAPDANLHELNHLAQRLSSLSAWELDCFEGMVMMDAVQTQYAPHPGGAAHQHDLQHGALPDCL